MDDQQARLKLEQPGASYVLLGFPDAEHDAAIVLSQSDAAKVCFQLCFEAAARGGDRTALRHMHDLLCEGAQSGPGEVEPHASERFPGEAGLGSRVRDQLQQDFGADPLASSSEAVLRFPGASFDRALEHVFPDGGAGSTFGESSHDLRRGCGLIQNVDYEYAPSDLVYVGKDEL